MRRREFLATAAAAVALPVSRMVEAAAERHLLYIAEPGIRNYVEYGGVGVLVYDIGASYKFVKRIPTWTTPAGQEPENVKGVVASAKTGRESDRGANVCHFDPSKMTTCMSGGIIPCDGAEGPKPAPLRAAPE